MHRGRSDTAANANANSDAPREFASEFWPPISNKKLRIKRCEGIRNANANGFANEMVKIPFSLRNFLANGSLRQNSLATANAMAWCTQLRAQHGESRGGYMISPWMTVSSCLPRRVLKSVLAMS